MNWKKFKEQVEAGGVTDETELDFIDVSAGSLEFSKDNELNVSIGKYGFTVM